MDSSGSRRDCKVPTLIFLYLPVSRLLHLSAWSPQLRSSISQRPLPFLCSLDLSYSSGQKSPYSLIYSAFTKLLLFRLQCPPSHRFGGDFPFWLSSILCSQFCPSLYLSLLESYLRHRAITPMHGEKAIFYFYRLYPRFPYNSAWPNIRNITPDGFGFNVYGSLFN